MKYCIAKMNNRILSYLLAENGRAVEIHADELEDRNLLGNIYIGRVQKVVKNIQAAFVEISPGVPCYLPLEDLRDPIYTKKGPSKDLQQGDELVVQVSREAMKTKGPSVTTRLSLQGRYVILDGKHPGIGISKKLEEGQREQLRRIAEFYRKDLWADSHSGSIRLAETAGIVIRTNAACASEEAILEELRKLSRQLADIRGKAPYRTCYSCLHQMPPGWLRRFNGLRMRDTQFIMIEDEQLYLQARQYLQEYLPELLPILVHYQDPLLPMHKLYSLERELSEALSQRVWLRSGGYLVIQPTEALTVVDVNSGKYEAGKKKEETILKVNLEAARETARQMRLRNLSGIIIIDFINMETEEAKNEVLGELRARLLLDPLQANVVDMTKLNLVEVVRKKVEGPLMEHVV